MTRHIRLLVLMARPPVVVLLGLITATGLAQAGHGEDRLLLVKVLAVVVAYLLFSVLVNDVADQAIDAVNLAGDPRRPLVTGAATGRDLSVLAVVMAGVAVVGAAAMGPAVLGVVAIGLTVSATYSLRPIRVADRGALASLLLPAGYVAVPYLVGILAARGHVERADLVLLAGLYVGFIGRLLLKDFRDVRGDALFGKRTFLVRHGRRWTCIISGGCFAAGALALAAVRGATVALVSANVVWVGAVLMLLRGLAVDGGARRDERLISAIAIVSRGVLLSVIAHLSMRAAHWVPLAYTGVLVALVVVVLGQAHTMLRHGPRTGLTVPAAWTPIERTFVRNDSYSAGST